MSCFLSVFPLFLWQVERSAKNFPEVKQSRENGEGRILRLQRLKNRNHSHVNLLKGLIMTMLYEDSLVANTVA